MPTLPIVASAIPPAGAAPEESIARSTEMIVNTAPFDVSGHPATSVPAGLAGGLPVGLMIVGRHFDDATCLRAAQAFETADRRVPAPASCLTAVPRAAAGQLIAAAPGPAAPRPRRRIVMRKWSP